MTNDINRDGAPVSAAGTGLGGDGVSVGPDRGGPDSGGAETVPVRRRWVFTGHWREYFGIWIVNIALTILTLGIYSAWAKVRRERYFYGHTRMEGMGFEYHAEPLQILIGRIIALGLLFVYGTVLDLMPLVGLALTGGMLFLFPWLVMRGLRFRARVSSFDNVRFDHEGSYGGAFKAYIVGPIVAFLSFGLATPIVARWNWHYLIDNLRYGGLPLATRPALKPLYWAFFVAVIGFVCAAFLFSGLSAMVIALGWPGVENSVAEHSIGDTDVDPDFMLIFLMAYGALLAASAVAAAIFNLLVRNVCMSAALLDNTHQLISDVPLMRYLWVIISNLVATIASLGLMRPWAAVRMAGLMAAHSGAEIHGELGQLRSAAKNAEGVVGSEYLDIEGIELGV